MRDSSHYYSYVSSSQILLLVLTTLGFPALHVFIQRRNAFHKRPNNDSIEMEIDSAKGSGWSAPFPSFWEWSLIAWWFQANLGVLRNVGRWTLTGKDTGLPWHKTMCTMFGIFSALSCWWLKSKENYSNSVQAGHLMVLGSLVTKLRVIPSGQAIWLAEGLSQAKGKEMETV